LRSDGGDVTVTRPLRDVIAAVGEGVEVGVACGYGEAFVGPGQLYVNEHGVQPVRSPVAKFPFTMTGVGVAVGAPVGATVGVGVGVGVAVGVAVGVGVGVGVGVAEADADGEGDGDGLRLAPE